MQNLERVVQDLVTENAALQSRVQEVTELQQQQLQSSEREKQTIRQQLTAELTREQQQTQEMRQQVRISVCVVCEALVADFQKSLQQKDSELESLKAKVTSLNN